jgi:hypothetical protein
MEREHGLQSGWGEQMHTVLHAFASYSNGMEANLWWKADDISALATTTAGGLGEKLHL